MVPLSKLLRVKTILLQQGQTPQQAGLCDHCSSHDCIELLVFLHQSWCEDTNARFGARHPVAQNAQLYYKLEGIYAHLSGKLFKQPKQDSTLGSTALKQIETFGRVSGAASAGVAPSPLSRPVLMLARTSRTGVRPL